MLLRVDSTSTADTALLVADGEIDLATVGTLRTAFTKAVQAGARHLTIDLDQVTYIDSSGLGTLIGAHKRLGSSGGTLTIHCCQPRVLRLLTVTGIDRVLTITGQDHQADDAPRVEATPA